MDYKELDKHIEKLKKCEYIQDANAVKKICEMAKELLNKEENVIYLNAPITVRKKYLFKFYRYAVTYMVNFTI